MVSDLLSNSVCKVDLADASESKCDIPDGFYNFLWKTVQKICEKPFKDPNFIRNT